MSRLLVTSSSSASITNIEATANINITTPPPPPITTTTTSHLLSKLEQINETIQVTNEPTVEIPSNTQTATTISTKTQEQTQQPQKPNQIVQVSLSVQLFKPEKLYPTPSMADNLPFDVEFDLRLVGCELIQTAGRLLKLPQTAMATGQVLFHRYYYIRSFVKCQMEIYAMAAIFLACKIEESPRRIRDVMNVFYHLKLVRAGKVIKPMPIDEVYADTKHQIIKAERKILKDLGFCVHVKHPHKIIFIYLQAMECSQLNLSQKAWNYMNDSFRTDIFLRYAPENIVCACIYLSANESEISLPQNPPWYTIFGANEDTIKEICIRILQIYSHQTRTMEELEKIVSECRENLGEKKRNKEATAIGFSSTTITSTVTNQEESILESKEETSKSLSESVKQTIDSINAASVSSAAKSHKTHSPNTNTLAASSIAPHPYYQNPHHHHQHHHPHHAYNYPPPNYPIPYPGPPLPHPSLARQSGYNLPYSYYHEQGYMHGDPYYDSYHNENYYQINNIRRNKSASNVRNTSQYKEEEYSMSRKRYSSRDKSADREYSNKISNQTNRYDYHKVKNKSKSRSRSPWKKREKSKDRDSRKRSKSRSRSSESKHKKKKSSHSRSRKEENRTESSNHRKRDTNKSRSRSTSRKRSSKSKHISKDSNSKETDDNNSRYVSILS